MPDYSKTYSTLSVQPIDLINAFKLDFCFASIIKWMTKWHMERKNEHLIKVRYYVMMCSGTELSNGFLFALKLYCQVNGFIPQNCKTCLLMDIASLVMKGQLETAIKKLNEIN